MSAYNPYHQLLLSSKNLHKYLVPGAGRRLAEAHEELLGIDHRLPDHYLKYHKQWKKKPQAWIHIRQRHEKYERDEFGQIQSVQEPNIPVIYPYEFHQGLWGGEGVVKGLEEPPPQKHSPNYKWPKPMYWVPKLHESVVYSEVLNKHIRFAATKRAEWLIDQHCGFDSYLLETPVNEIYALVPLKVKREILLSLARETLWPDDAGRKRDVLDKYKDFILPEEEADWHGLSIMEARHKFLCLERLFDEECALPKKSEYRKELVNYLKQGYLEDVDPALLHDDSSSTVSSVLTNITKRFK